MHGELLATTLQKFNRLGFSMVCMRAEDAVGHSQTRCSAGGLTNHAPSQEVTENIYALLSSKAWWRRYMASPCPPDRPYFTALLHLRDAVQRAQPVRLRDFKNSVMGAHLAATHVLT